MKRSPHRFQRWFSLAECLRLEAAMEVEKKGEEEDVCSRLSAIEVAKELGIITHDIKLNYLDGETFWSKAGCEYRR